MGCTLPSASMLLMHEISNFTPFKRALAPRDQVALEELFIYANLHVAEAAYTAFELPMQTFMLAMLLEMHKEVIRLRKEIEGLSPGLKSGK